MKQALYFCIVASIVLSLVRFGVCFTYLQDLKLNCQLDQYLDNTKKDNTKKSISPKLQQKLSYKDNTKKIDKAEKDKKVCRVNTFNNKKAYVAIILDDCGYSFNERIRKFIQAGYKVNLSIIPGTPFSKDIGYLAKSCGLDVMLHMPMQSEGELNAYKYKITLDMSEEEIESNTVCALSSIGDFVVAANNHMGSRVTQDRGVMYPFLLTLAKHGLFFVDSITTPKSVTHKIAKLINIPVLTRDVFLDNIAQVSYTKHMLRLLIAQAKRKGYAIGIGHIKETTLKALEEMYPHFNNSNVEFVSISYLLNNVIKKG